MAQVPARIQALPTHGALRLFAAAALTLAACGDSSTTTVITTGATPRATTSTTSATNSTTSSSLDLDHIAPAASTTSDLRQAFDTALRPTWSRRGPDQPAGDCVLDQLRNASRLQIQATISGQVPKAVAGPP